MFSWALVFPPHTTQQTFHQFFSRINDLPNKQILLFEYEPVWGTSLNFLLHLKIFQFLFGFSRLLFLGISSLPRLKSLLSSILHSCYYRLPNVLHYGWLCRVFNLEVAGSIPVISCSVHEITEFCIVEGIFFKSTLAYRLLVVLSHKTLFFIKK